MRANPTDAERALWRALRGMQMEGFKFRRQYVLYSYIVDFVCLESRLIVEVDGAQHAERAAYDARRDHFLHEEGFRVLRFSDREVLTAIRSAIEATLQVLTLPPP